eukprot:Awhi_evm1s14507
MNDDIFLYDQGAFIKRMMMSDFKKDIKVVAANFMNYRGYGNKEAFIVHACGYKRKDLFMLSYIQTYFEQLYAKKVEEQKLELAAANNN